MERLTDDRFLKDGFYQPKSKEEEKEIRSMGNDLTFEKLYKHCAEVEKQNSELQKQVEKLTEQRNKNYLKGEIIMKDEKTLLNEIKEQCGNCEAWSGTDCTRNPYTQGCLKDEKQVIECYGMLKGFDMVKQAVKDTAKEIFAKVKELLSHLDNEWEVSNALYPLEKEYGVEVE